MSNTVFFYNAKPSGQIEGELNPETNGGLYEYLREIKFCTGQESVDVVQRKKIFKDKNHYLFTYFKKCVLREDGSSYRPYYTFIYATSAFTKTLERTPRDQRLARQSAFSGLQ